MKPTLQYEAPLLSNEDRFQDPFFRRFALRPAAAPLQLDEAIAKDYRFPTFYADVTCAIGIFLCDYEAARAMLPHPAMRPVAVPGGRAVVTISCYEYRNVMNVPPYNEVAFTIPVLMNAPLSVPLLPLLWGGYPGFGYYVFHMPVTSLENRIRGNRIWGLPKVTEEIDVREEDGDCVTDIRDEQGRRYFSLRVPTEGKPTEFDVAAWLYSRKDGELLRAQTNFKARFAVRKYMSRLWSRSARPEREFLTIGEGGIADRLRALQIDPHPFQFRFARGMNAAFDLPDESWSARG